MTRVYTDLAKPADVVSWLEIVREVEPLFGLMPDFEKTLLRKIEQKSALCVRAGNEDGPAVVLGGMLLGGTSADGWIRWLAVRGSARRGGIGRCLVRAALDRMGEADTISLDTFCEEMVAGRPARRLYAQMGFSPGVTGEADGQLCQRFVLSRVREIATQQ
jgi:ribosomal protein S18 acetylase RimI-like enzyme